MTVAPPTVTRKSLILEANHALARPIPGAQSTVIISKPPVEGWNCHHLVIVAAGRKLVTLGYREGGSSPHLHTLFPTTAHLLPENLTYIGGEDFLKIFWKVGAMSYLTDILSRPFEDQTRDEIAADRAAREPELRERLRPYRLSVPEYHAMLQRQQGNCAACGKPVGRPVVDHCHLTLEVRGLVHGKCNSILGFADDSPATLRALAAYLEKSRE
jgi:hypothetical protein